MGDQVLEEVIGMSGMKWLMVWSMFALRVQSAELPAPIFAPGERVLFQGDSITDGNRGRSADPNHILGHGYAFVLAAKYGAAYPEWQIAFFNRGVSGNKVTDLAARWQTDTLDLKPDVLSILIGVNDLLSDSNRRRSGWIGEYEEVYDKLLAKARAGNPKIKFVLCEPFILPGKATSQEWLELERTLRQLQAVIERLAVKYQAPVVHFQKIFDNAARRKVPADYWIWDGIHPTYAGHQLMADEWSRTYEKFYGTVSRKARGKPMGHGLGGEP